MPSLKDNLLKFGVLKCRDLVELFYGARMVAQSVTYAPGTSNGSPVIVLPQDTRRISYEIAFSCFQSSLGNAGSSIALGTKAQIEAGRGVDYYALPYTTVVVKRSFFEDLDAVTEEVYYQNVDNNYDLEARVVILTPAPIDEVPLG